MRASHNCSGLTFVQELTPQSVRQFNEAEVTAKSALSVCRLWNWLSGALGFSLESLGRGSIAGQCQTLLVQAYNHLVGATKGSVLCCLLSWAWRCLGEDVL